MTVTLRAVGTAVNGTTSLSPAVPGSAVSGDVSVLDVSVKPYTVALPDLSGSGWAKIADTTSGTTAAGASTGSMRLGRYVRASAVASSTVSVSLPSGTASLAVISTWYSSTGDTLDLTQTTTGVDGSAGTSFSATAAGGIGVASGDVVLAAMNQCAATNITSPAVGGMSGATLGTQTTQSETLQMNTHGSGLHVRSVPVTAGSSSSAPSFAASVASTVQGCAVFTRLREVAATEVDSTVRVGVRLAPVVKSATQVDTGLAVGVRLAPATEAADASGAVHSGLGAGAKLAPVVRSARAAQSGLGVGAALAPVTVASTRVDSTLRVGVSLRPVVGVAELPPPLDHRILITTPEYRDALQASTRQATGQVEFIDDSDVVVATFGGVLVQGQTLVPRRGVLSATVTDDANAEVRRRGQIAFADPALVPDTQDDLLHPDSLLRARVWHLVKVGPLWQRVLMATGHLSFSAQDSTTEFGIQCQMEDSFSVVRRALWTTEALSVGGLPNHVALERIFDAAAPWLRYQITPTEFVLPPDYELGRPGNNPVADAREIATAAGLDLHVDRWGVIVAEPVDQQTHDDVGVFREGPGCHIRSLSRSISMDDRANVVLVMSSNTSLETPVSAMVEDTDPTSPTWVGRRRRYVRVVQSDVVTTTAQCQALGAQILAQSRALTETIQLQAMSVPHLNARASLIDVATQRSRAVGAFEVQAGAFVVGADAGMTVNCAPRRVSLLDL